MSDTIPKLREYLTAMVAQSEHDHAVSHPPGGTCALDRAIAGLGEERCPTAYSVTPAITRKLVHQLSHTMSDARGWHAICVCGWKSDAFNGSVIDVMSAHIADATGAKP